MSIKITKNIDFTSIVNRIKQVKSLRYDYEVADLLRFRPKALAARKRLNKIPEDRLKVFCNQESINFDWVLTGKGEPQSHLGGEGDDSHHAGNMKQVNFWSVRPGLVAGAPPNSSPLGPFCFIREEIWSKFRGPFKALTVNGTTSSPVVRNGDKIIVACGEREVSDQNMYAIITQQYLDARQCHKVKNLLILSPLRLGDPIEKFDLDKDPDPLVGQIIGIIKS
ncbi:MAG: hypothetical protein JSU88_09750 [Nitrospinaceae bacterium]|jgi:hypothetical protein|nr:MAG: hypothetical protein JSU88_09750 [Nitrospinaceae bacterium]UCD33440.1 MAG: hypothetical protein JSV38_06115 [Desulfobacterales bacterium]